MNDLFNNFCQDVLLARQQYYAGWSIEKDNITPPAGFLSSLGRFFVGLSRQLSGDDEQVIEVVKERLEGWKDVSVEDWKRIIEDLSNVEPDTPGSRALYDGIEWVAGRVLKSTDNDSLRTMKKSLEALHDRMNKAWHKTPKHLPPAKKIAKRIKKMPRGAFPSIAPPDAEWAPGQLDVTQTEASIAAPVGHEGDIDEHRGESDRDEHHSGDNPEQRVLQGRSEQTDQNADQQQPDKQDPEFNVDEIKG